MASDTPMIDDDAPELTPEQLARLRPARDVLTPEQYAAVMGRRGRPKAERPKVPVTIRLDSEIVEAFKATGQGWQTRMNETLRRAVPRLKRPVGESG